MNVHPRDTNLAWEQRDRRIQDARGRQVRKMEAQEGSLQAMDAPVPGIGQGSGQIGPRCDLAAPKALRRASGSKF